MTIDKALLRQAWPDGYLAMRGVLTVGGWTVESVNKHEGKAVAMQVRNGEWLRDVRWFGGILTVEHTSYVKLVESGDLLPNVDPADTATWACLLRDLATVWCPEWSWDEHTNVSWSRLPPDEEEGAEGLWWLVLDHPPGAHPHYVRISWDGGTEVGTDDPALALVLAMIGVRNG